MLTSPALKYAVYTHKGLAQTIDQGWARAWKESRELGHECRRVSFQRYSPDYDDFESSITDLFSAIK